MPVNARPESKDETLEVRVIGGHTRARQLDFPYATFLVTGLGMAVIAVNEKALGSGAYPAGHVLWTVRAQLTILVSGVLIAALPLAFFSAARHFRHGPFLVMAGLWLATPVAAIFFDLYGTRGAWSEAVLISAAASILIPSWWFIRGRRKILEKRFRVPVFPYGARRAVSIGLITLGCVGSVVWPGIFRIHYSHEGMGGFTGGPATLIFLGYLPPVLIIVIGLARYPYRRYRRGRYARRPPDTA